MEIRQIMPDSGDYAAMLDLRDRVLRKPLGRSISDADKALDASGYLMGCFEGPVILGCLILQKQQDGSVKMRQVAVDGAAQGKGVGRQMMQAAYQVVKGWGLSHLYCHARETAAGFYRRNGWQVTGDMFLEQGIPHFRMETVIAAESHQPSGLTDNSFNFTASPLEKTA